MSYSIKLIRKNEQITKPWSGGLTTELAIYPKDAEYNQRNFIWRVSTASVQAETSLFTILAGFWRVIMVLNGEMLLEHEGHHRAFLKPFEQDRFYGGWTTRSVGKVQDFNLMLAEGYSGEVQSIQLKKGLHHEIVTNQMEFSPVVEAFYCIQGIIAITINENEALLLNQGDFALFTRQNSEHPNIKLCNPGEITANIIRTTCMRKE